MFRPRSESEDEEVPLMTRGDTSVRAPEQTAETSFNDVSLPSRSVEASKVGCCGKHVRVYGSCDGVYRDDSRIIISHIHILFR